ncbi:EF-hand domain-containing protein [Sphingomonas sabuli]|uniref:EF-hand domain-containing protein n=1 Tax=Sphingomonas sabuli TaxID=2764186 RepID=A0A7G9KZC7_9SPHN|nr:EF-hand domain-containing protein [Sphingomonas sabuli]QNM81726.1 EF-hand domain-containing protein [Sphingomonas sabuli]
MIATAATAVFASAAATGQTAAGDTQPLTRAGYLAIMNGEFAKLDTNRDGKVTQAELAAQQQGARAAAASQQARALFNAIDVDRNGQISVDEFIRGTVKPAASTDVSAMMKRIDTDRDGFLSVIEYRVATLSGFDQVDTDKDGQLTSAEQRASGLRK